MKKRYFIAVDCEGVACAVGYPGSALSEPNASFAKRQASREAASAAKALFDAGADDVIVWDNHSTGVNLDYSLLDKRCKILLGSGHKIRFPELDESITAVLFIGYHSKAGTPNAALAHTYSSSSIQYYKINGRETGELGIDAAYAGEYGVPVLFCSSDDKCVAEAKSFFGDIATVTTKKSLSWNSVLSRHPDAVCEDIYNTVLEAAKEGPRVMPYVLPSPVTVEIRYHRQDTAANAALKDMNGNNFELIDGFTRKGVLRSITDLF